MWGLETIKAINKIGNQGYGDWLAGVPLEVLLVAHARKHTITKRLRRDHGKAVQVSRANHK